MKSVNGDALGVAGAVAPRQFDRRQVLRFAAAAGAGAWLGMGGRAHAAAAYPLSELNFIVPEGAGGIYDTYAREFARALSESLHINVEPLNQPGAGGAMAIFELYHDAPDGSNISMIGLPGALLHKSAPGFDINKLTWLATLGRDAFGAAVGAHSPIKSIAELQRLSQQRPVRFSIDGPGSTGYFATKAFVAAFGLRAEYVVGYSGSTPQLLAPARGEVDVNVNTMTSMLKVREAGLIRPIFVMQAQSNLPGVEDTTTANKPQLDQIYEWRAVVAPPGLSPDLTSILSNALFTAAKSPEVITWAKSIDMNLYPLDRQATLQMLKEQESLIKTLT
jgi:putative tricarboxylic transport membrane protein